MSDITLEQAQLAVQAALNKSREIDVKINIAVVDAGANLKAFARMDDAWLGSIDISLKKAKTARFFDMNSGDIGGLSQPGGDLYNIEHSNNGLITFPGGIPIRNNEGEIIGAIGVSGSTVENDHTVASAGAIGYCKSIELATSAHFGALAFLYRGVFGSMHRLILFYQEMIVLLFFGVLLTETPIVLDLALFLF